MTTPEQQAKEEAERRLREQEERSAQILADEARKRSGS